MQELLSVSSEMGYPKSDELSIQNQSWLVNGIKYLVWILVFACGPKGKGGWSGVF